MCRWDDEFHSPDLATRIVGHYRHSLDMQRPDETRLFRSLIRSDLPEEAQAIGKQGFVCMAAQEKFLRKEPPVHLVFEPEEGNEEEGEDQANFEPAVEGPIPQQEAHAHREEVVYELQAQPHAEVRVQDPSLPVQGGDPSTEAETSANAVCTSYASPLPIQIPYGSPLGPFSNSPMFTQVWNVSNPISWPSDSILTRSWVLSLLNAFDWGSKYLAPSEFSLLLPIYVFGNLVSFVSKILHTEPNCITIDGLGANSSIVVVGDIHGQLHDLIFLLQDAGFLADDKVFVFNGDYVDRGAWGLETFLLLLAWKLHVMSLSSLQATEERYKNKGAYIVLVPPHFDSPVFHSFEAVTPRPESGAYVVGFCIKEFSAAVSGRPNEFVLGYYQILSIDISYF
ncbi:hypothetical protein Vadar_011580 [Vaccinium darrowii]|uniref:Uncharacterized protein n=1 Tax=Vaccinium darrowii TaxID=229202 RepID=A0ACB7XZX8_9ERIC|nr:hypothetical protein Vadar_011580 [Vaccinium darrowii]